MRTRYTASNTRTQRITKEKEEVCFKTYSKSVRSLLSFPLAFGSPSYARRQKALQWLEEDGVYRLSAYDEI